MIIDCREHQTIQYLWRMFFTYLRRYGSQPSNLIGNLLYSKMYVKVYLVM